MLGRRKEQQALAAVVEAARDGLSGVLVLRGEAGVGKTALLDDAVRAAGDLRVLRVEGVESEMELGFAGLHQLVVPELGRLDGLPGPLRTTLQRVFGLIDGDPPDPMLVGLAVLTILAEAASERGLLCVIDDAEWLDHSSAEALAFVARRLFADRVAMLFAVREPGWPPERHAGPSGLTGLPELVLDGLDDASAIELLVDALGHPLDAATAARVVAEFEGNPLALSELAREMTADQLSGRTVLDEPLPLGGRLESCFVRQVQVLPEDTQALLLALAAEPTGDDAVVHRVGAQLRFTEDAADAALAARLVVRRDGLRFRHPLIRSAVYHHASLEQRRRTHAALAAALDVEQDADRRAWHRAAATRSHDAEIAQELVEAATRARARGGYPAAAAFLHRAASLTPDADLRVDRSLDAASLALDAGTPRRARAILAEVAPALDGPSRALARRLDGLVHMALRETRDTPGALVEGALALREFDLSLARETLLDAMTVAIYAGRYAGDASLAAIARAAKDVPLPAEAARTSGDEILDALVVLGIEGLAAGIEPVRRAASVVLHGAGDPQHLLRWLNFSCWAAGAIGDHDLRQALANRLEELTRQFGALGARASALHYLGLSEISSGALGDADAHFFEEFQIEVARGTAGMPGAAGSFLVLAWRGRESEARVAAVHLADVAQVHGWGWVLMLVEHGLAVLELGLGRYEAAAQHAAQAAEADELLWTTALPDAIEAAVRIGDASAAAERLATLAARTAGNRTPFVMGLLARAEGLVEARGDPEDAYRRAVDLLHESGATGHEARARLVYGEWLRRQKRRREARIELRAALDAFTAIGAEAFAERARIELRATGETARKRTIETCDQLTPQEAQVARLAARGATNPEIAAQLFLSPATVEYHLRKVYRKLDISSRRGLVGADLDTRA